MELTNNLKHLLNLKHIQDLINNNNWDRLLSIINASYGPTSPEIIQICSILRELEKSGTPIEIIDMNNKITYLERIVIHNDVIITGMNVNFGNKKIISSNQILTGEIIGINYVLSNIKSAFSSKQELFNNICWKVMLHDKVFDIFTFDNTNYSNIFDIKGNCIKLPMNLD